jgi:SAM-dependent methyltransferase
VKDKKTHEYFDKFTPHYKPERFNFAIQFLKKHSNAENSLIDIGCGDGATLWLVKERTPLKRLTGLDISTNYLKKAQELVGCEAVEGSILDNDFLDKYRRNYDYCTLGAVLHHLIGKNRKASASYAAQCLKNSMALLKPGGYLIIFEPTHSPSFLMTIVFYLKKIVGHFADNRVELYAKWINFGHPVVSYYTVEQVIQFIDNLPNTDTIQKVIVDKKRLGYLIKRIGLGLIIRKSLSDQPDRTQDHVKT